ncbi:MAG: tRNA lysidine(34) synthetase TilS [Epsilonproteobacteria bacterium]|nr:MAG: tRNA lysidine(34) synthetase TilS [Campylobacterota bacterium]
MQHFTQLVNKKILLAYSAGIDSSALFFMLIEAEISFDIALVNYGTRAQSDVEEKHAIALGKKYNLKAYTIKAPLWKRHFEANARTFRYNFFERLICEHNYDTLITAHQLNDQLEWFLMRLTKGAGVSELIGLEPLTARNTTDGKPYILVRPLLKQSKAELLHYLERNNYTYFVDESNQDKRFERNQFRQEFSDPLLAKYHDGIKRSFSYLHDDKERLLSGIECIFIQDELRVLSLKSPKLRAKAADLTLKELGYLLSSNQRKEIEQKDSIVIGGKWAVVYQDHRLYIAPFLTISMPKKFKELSRVSNLPIKIRPYCYAKGMAPVKVTATYGSEYS